MSGATYTTLPGYDASRLRLSHGALFAFPSEHGIPDVWVPDAVHLVEIETYGGRAWINASHVRALRSLGDTGEERVRTAGGERLPIEDPDHAEVTFSGGERVAVKMSPADLARLLRGEL